jgi:acetyl esterase/lipase
MKPHLAKLTIRLSVSAAALVVSSSVCSADTCPADVQASFPPNEETLDSAYQPPAPDGNILHRYRFAPPGAGPYNQYPTVLMFPPDVFYLEYGDHGTPSERIATHDLQWAGFLVFQVDHRLAPPNHLPGQHTNGEAPAQTDDAKRQILAALADPQCNGSIYLIGGSAGGTLALWCGLDSASTVTGWDNNARLHIKAVLSFSGPANLDDWSHPDITDYTMFETRVDNYVGLVYPDHTHGPLLAASPVNLITTGAATSSPPVMLFGSQYDEVSHTQQDDMKSALLSIGALVTYVYFPGSSDHAFHNWHVISPITGNCVSTDVINFLYSYP